MLIQAVSDSAEVEQNLSPTGVRSVTDSDSDSRDSLGNEMDGASTEASNPDGFSSARPQRFATPQFTDLLQQTDDNVIFVSEQLGTDQPGQVHSATWGECVEEVEWTICFHPSKPFIKPCIEQTDDGWYQGQDCVDPSEIASVAKKAILSAADGSLALKQDAVLPGASRGRTKYNRMSWSDV